MHHSTTAAGIIFPPARQRGDGGEDVGHCLCRVGVVSDDGPSVQTHTPALIMMAGGAVEEDGVGSQRSLPSSQAEGKLCRFPVSLWLCEGYDGW